MKSSGPWPLRQGGEADLAPCERLLRRHMQPYFDRYAITWRSDRFASAWQQQAPWVIEGPRGPIGFLLLLPQADHHFVHSVHVDIRYRGRGLGSRLMQHAEYLAWQADKRRVELSVYADNPALHWYQRLGYQRQGQPYFQMLFRKELTEAPQAVGSNEEAPLLIWVR